MASAIDFFIPATSNASVTLYHPQSLVGQSFISPTNGTLQQARFYIAKDGSPTGPMYAKLYSSAGTFGTSSNTVDTLLATSDSVDASTLSSTAAWIQFNFNGANEHALVANGEYVIVVHYPSGGSVGNYPVVYMATPGYMHPGVAMAANFSGSWTYPDYEVLFSVWSDSAPLAQFTASTTAGAAPLSVNFTDTSLYTPTSWSWTFGDGGTSTSQNPTRNYTTPGLYSVSLQATNANGSGTSSQVTQVDVYKVLSPSSIASTLSVGTPTAILSDPPPPPDTDWSALGKEDEKVYVYKVRTSGGTYLGIWPDVVDDLEFSQRLNTPGTTTTVRLGRSANTTKEVRDDLTAENGDTLTTEDSLTLVSVSETNNSVGEDTDVDVNYDVDVYVHYGEFADLMTENGDTLTTEADETLIVTSGAPLGTRIFSGYILDYDAGYGADDAGVTVTLASHGMELSHEIIRSGTTTTVTYTSTSLENIAKAILDTNPGTISYSTASIGTTGVSETLTFRLNTKLKGLETVYDQTPDGWYWYVNVAENTLYLQQISADYDHIFYYGEHIQRLRVKRSIEDLRNAVWFVGGESAGVPVYKYYEDATSQSTYRKGVEIITDRRYTIAASMQRRADKLMGRYSEPIFTSPLTISSAKYDIESIQLGQTVGFRNFDNFIDELPPLQIVSLAYTPSAVTVELGELQMRQIDEVAEAQSELELEQFETLPNAPS